MLYGAAIAKPIMNQVPQGFLNQFIISEIMVTCSYLRSKFELVM